jgi:tetratricopeptide (TPR) repeat protein
MARRKRKQKQDEELLVDIVEARESASDFIDRNQKTIFGALTAFVILVGGYFAYKYLYAQPKQAEAVEQMYQAQWQFERDSFALALTNPGGGYSGFLDIIDNYGGTDAANVANFYAGISYLNLGQFDAAISYLNDFSPAGEVIPMMKYGALGDAYSEKGDLAKAMSYYQDAANEEENEALTPYYLKKIGMLHEKEGRMAEAKKAYEEIKSKYPESAAGRDIEKYIIKVSQG